MCQVSIPTGAIEGSMTIILVVDLFWFQYQQVQLKVPIDKDKVLSVGVSIPTGAIEGLLTNGLPYTLVQFQYQQVQLKE